MDFFKKKKANYITLFLLFLILLFQLFKEIHVARECETLPTVSTIDMGRLRQ